MTASARSGLLILLVTGYLSVGYSQLIGSRGVFTLPEGQYYRDEETVQASKDVARFARSYQVNADQSASQNRRYYTNQLTKTPRFYTRKAEQKGRKLSDAEVFDFVDSRYVDPLPETKFNKPLEEVDVERTTSPTRLIPGQNRFNHQQQQQQHVSSLAQRTFATAHALNYFNGAPLRPPHPVPIVHRPAAATAVPVRLAPPAGSAAGVAGVAGVFPSHSYQSNYEVGVGAVPTSFHTDRVPSSENFYILNNQRIN